MGGLPSWRIDELKVFGSINVAPEQIDHLSGLLN